MDTGLFQILSLVLLVVMVALLALALSALSGIKKAVEARAAPRPAPEPEEALGPEGALGAEGALGPEATAAPEAVDLTPAAAEPTGAAARQEDVPQEAAQPAPAQVTPAEAEPARAEEPVATDTFAAAGTGAAAAEPEPENQPFEREGRWWFRRGEELLVYDEQTGQWLPAPHPVPGGQATVGGAAASPAGATSEGEGQGGFWKCPSCGAVNGSTATSCRMCFAQRP